MPRKRKTKTPVARGPRDLKESKPNVRDLNVVIKEELDLSSSETYSSIKQEIKEEMDPNNEQFGEEVCYSEVFKENI